ncbi:heavy metal-associated domain-containing protein [uncultured Salinibacterium sp.]|uniref:heavy-metal-associated domain-containing protein n=1 Tax=uncultured Salinibacterium sp. TaxID=459274 RepID=UPI0030DA7191
MTSIDRVDLGLTDGSGCSCCATSTAPASEPASGAYETEVQVQGMTCSHCVASVTEQLGSLDGVLAVTVALVSDGVSTATVSSSIALEPEQVRSAVEEAGYSLATTQAEPSPALKSESN